MKDPFYRKILEGLERLEGPRDWESFEECAVALLRDVYPGLVPVRGGQDHGMDGAIADAEGSAYPLVVTTAKDFRRNLKGSLDAYRKSGSPRRRVVMATSRALTPRERRELERQAQDEGFVLVQVHDRHDFAGRLYRDSRWVQELLGIPSEPSALSAVPMTRRPLRDDLPLIGRDADLEWLEETTGDRLVVGEPGSGKTYLLLQLVRQGRALALFLASGDEGQVATACRELEPEIILVDDAHLEPGSLDRLRRLRSEIGARYDVIATCWPGSEDVVAEALGLGGRQRRVRDLELLTRRQILEVLRAMGVSAPDDDPHLRSLVDQAANKPGLAVTLGSLWLRGEWREVLTGQAIRRTLLPSLKRVLGSDPTDLLACFALGGDGGMSTEVVGEYLGLGKSEMYQRTTLTGSGGVLKTLGDDRLAVQPELLRPALLQEFFFTEPTWAYRELLEKAPRPGAAVETLVLAACCGASVPEEDLEELVLEHGSPWAWRQLATLSESWGRWVLEEYPRRWQDVIWGVLVGAPQAALGRLLHEAPGAEGPLHSTPSHPLRILSDWVQELVLVPGREDVTDTGETLRRRRLVVDAALEFIEEGGDRTVGLRACFLALSPRLESLRPTVRGKEDQLRWAALPPSAFPEVLNIWERVCPRIDELASESWSTFREALWGWIHPPSLGVEVAREEVSEMRAVAARILRDLRELLDGEPGFAWALKALADRLDMSLELSLDEAYGALFVSAHERCPQSLHEEPTREQRRARELARAWAARRPDDVAKKLAFYCQQAERFGHRDTRDQRAFWQTLAERVEEPEEWLRAFIRARFDPGWLVPILERITDDRREGWIEALEGCLTSEVYRWAAADVLIRASQVPGRLLESALEAVDPHLVETATLGAEIPVETLRRLLEDERSEISLAAAVGEWSSDPMQQVRSELEAEWREAVLRAGSGGGIDRKRPEGTHHWLREILASDPALASSWLERRLADVEEEVVVAEEGAYAAAIKTLSEEERMRFVDQLEAGTWPARELVSLLVGDSPVVYERLLALDRLEGYHWEPLCRDEVDASWTEMARLAVEAGEDPGDVARTVCVPSGWMGEFGLEHWRKLRTDFESLRASGKPGLRRIAERGLEIVGEELRTAEERKRQFELSGKL